jgi:hypothetical protein
MLLGMPPEVCSLVGMNMSNGSGMTDGRLPDHSRLVYVVIGIVLLIIAIPLILLLILHVLASDVMH